MAVELPAGDHSLTTDATRNDGQGNAVILVFDAYDQFAQNDRLDRVTSSLNGVAGGPMKTTSDLLRRSEPGIVWLKLDNNSQVSELTIEFTLSAQ